jgi:hypothetical protein
MTPADLERVDDVTYGAMVRYMRREADAVRAASRKR